MKTIFSLLLACLVGATPSVRADIKTAEQHLAAREFDEALTALGGGEIPEESAGYAQYLRALANSLGGMHAEAVTACDILISEHPESEWIAKGRFLKARALIEQRKHKEAEVIFSEEAKRLFSSERKEDIANVLIQYADRFAAEPKPGELGAPPADFNKALALYQQALALEVGRDFKDGVRFKVGKMFAKLGNLVQANETFRAYLRDYDPRWSGPVGSPERFRGMKKEKPVEPGKHIWEVRLELVRGQLQSERFNEAKQNAEDILMAADAPGGTVPEAIRAEASWLLTSTVDHDVEQHIRLLREFLAKHPKHESAAEGSQKIALLYQGAGRTDEAIAAYEDFIEGDNYENPEGDEALEAGSEGISAVERLDREKKRAFYLIGHLRFQQGKFDEAIAHWKQYVAKFPDGADWAQCQGGIINAEFQKGIEAVASGEFEGARTQFEVFLKRYPLDGRSRQILFILGQIHFAEAKKMEEEGVAAAKVEAEYREAVAAWGRLTGKYPGSEEASLALYRIGRLQVDTFGELGNGLATFRKLTFGSWANPAAQRVAILTERQLSANTERVFRTNEEAMVKVSARNVAKISVSQYQLSLEDYFRKAHRIDNIHELDVDLIEPDKTWEVKFKGYADYRKIEEEVSIPFAKGKPGVCIVKITGGDREATTLVVRSDIDIVSKSSRREILVYAENRLGGKPVAGAEVLVSDGKAVFGVGATGDDGVFRGKFPELRDAGDVRFLVSGAAGVASNMLSTNDLGFGDGLTAKGYLYTGKPAYRPGEVVTYRAILRDVVEGSYAVPKDKKYSVRITDPAGRLIKEEDREIDGFGALDGEAELPEFGALGAYTVHVSKEGSNACQYSVLFQVQRFQLPKVKLDLEFDRQVYFRGETVEATITAEYAWGSPAANEPVTYHLPDGRSFTEKVDELGKLVVKLDTTGFTPGRALLFRADVPSANVSVQEAVVLAQLGFGISANVAEKVVLAGDEAELTVVTKSADGEPAAKELTVKVLRRRTAKLDPVLSEVPWVKRNERPQAEETMTELKVATDAKNGEATLRIPFETSGNYILRVSGEDRFGQTVSAETRVGVSGDEDAKKLRMFAEKSTFDVGETIALRIHSRLESGLALVTYESEEILGYSLIPVKKGWNPLDIPVGHSHFPNFRVAAVVMSGRRLYGATRDFTVRRELTITLNPSGKIAEPGEEIEVAVAATDQLGKPVEAALSLSLVNEALLAAFPDGVSPIVAFFQEGVRRDAEFRQGTSAGFEYAGVTRLVSKAVAEEGQRLERVSHEKERLEQMRNIELSLLGIRDEALQEQFEMGTGAFFARLQNDVDGELAVEEVRRLAEFQSGVTNINGAAQTVGGVIAAGFNGGLAEGGGDGTVPPRGDSDLASVWISKVVTGADGKAVVKIKMPENSASWRLVGRGVTVDTLVGATESEMVTKKELFVELSTPSVFQEGDIVGIMGTIHNLTDFEGEAEVEFKVEGGEVPFVSRKRVNVKAGSATKVVFEPFTVPFADVLTVTGSVVAGDRKDAVARAVAVRPWGLQYADYAGGLTGTEAGVSVELPNGQEYSGRKMMLSVSPSIEAAIVEMALGEAPVVRMLGRGRRSVLAPHRETNTSALLAAVSALEYARERKAGDGDLLALTERVKSLVSGLVVSQRDDGGWAWDGTAKASDWVMTSSAYWGLAVARKLGIPTNADTLGKARGFLNGYFPKLGAQDNEAKAIMQHALSVDGQADFSAVNRIYRERHTLNEVTLAYTGATLIRLGRKEFAREVLTLLEKKAKLEKGIAVWNTGSARPILREGREVAAMALWCYAKLSPDSAVARGTANQLLRQYGCNCFPSSNALGHVVHGLAGYFGDGVSAGEDLKVKVYVNGKLQVTLAGDEIRSTRYFAVPKEMILAGENMVRFEVEGTGEIRYGATLKGFSHEMKDPNSWSSPYPNGRFYYHDRLSYRGVPLRSVSTSPVERAEIGQKIRVESKVYSGASGDEYRVFEEPLPAGFLLVDGTVKGNFQRAEVGDAMIRTWYPPGDYVNTLTYDMVAHVPGDYKVLPPVIRDAQNHGRMRVGKQGAITVLRPGEKSEDRYEMNRHEHYELAQKLFDDGNYDEAEKHLDILFNHKDHRNHYERELARMLLWIYTSRPGIDGAKVVQMFEILRERHPELLIPFDKILRVGEAYRLIGEFERAWLVYSATITSSFLSDSNISAVLEDQGQYFGSIDYLLRLCGEYPDSADVVETYFAVSQSLYQHAPDAEALAKAAGEIRGGKEAVEKGAEKMKRDKVGMLGESLERLNQFLVLYPTNPMADDAAFALVNVFFDLKQYGPVVDHAGAFVKRYAESAFRSSFEYMTALGQFWQRQYAEALKSARPVADGESKDRDYARYIIAQIFHAQGKAKEALDWYGKVKSVYPDAGQAIGYFERKDISLDEVTTFAPGEKVELELSYRNVKSAHLQVYRVDLMKLYLREKNLTNITKVNLAGISPELEIDVELGDGKDYRDLEKKIALPMKDEGAYLVICRGGDLFTSGLVLVTKMKLEVQEGAREGSVRVNVIDSTTGGFLAEVHVKAIGSSDSEFQAGDTDLRGVFQADGLNGRATVIARDGTGRYAFYRGEKVLGAPKPDPSREAPDAEAAQQQLKQGDYLQNLKMTNDELQRGNIRAWDAKRRGGQKGVEVQKAY